MRLLVTRCLKKHIKCGSASFTDLIHYGAFSLPSFFFMDELSMLIFTERKPFHSDSVWTSLTLNFTVCVCVYSLAALLAWLSAPSFTEWTVQVFSSLSVPSLPAVCAHHDGHTHTPPPPPCRVPSLAVDINICEHTCVCVCCWKTSQPITFIQIRLERGSEFGLIDEI